MDYQRIYNALIEKAQSRESVEGYTEKHHIVPRSMGGSDDRSNMVILTYPEHMLSHHLLAKIHPTDKKLANAWYMMSCHVDKLEGRSWLASHEQARIHRHGMLETFTFYHKDHDAVTTTRIGMCRLIEEMTDIDYLDMNSICMLVTGNRKSVRGWTIDPGHVAKIVNAVHEFTNGVDTYIGTASEFSRFIGATVHSITCVVNKERKMRNGWYLASNVHLANRNKKERVLTRPLPARAEREINLIHEDGTTFTGTAKEMVSTHSISRPGVTRITKYGKPTKGWRLA